eukprot:scaffold17506_cov132-Isochrysis_galbana.AAC.9
MDQREPGVVSVVSPGAHGVRVGALRLSGSKTRRPWRLARGSCPSACVLPPTKPGPTSRASAPSASI